jgi:hypothetical protein
MEGRLSEVLQGRSRWEGQVSMGIVTRGVLTAELLGMRAMRCVWRVVGLWSGFES